MKLHNVYSCIPLIVSIFCFGLIHKVYANVADDLNANYNKIVNDCGSPRKPAFLCSGIMIRVTSTSHDYHTWDPSPNSISRQGVSFVYLRKDIKAHIDYVGKTSGIIYFPGIPNPEALPIQAFFYRDNGLVDAQYFQYDYYNVTNIWIPIVKMVQDTEGGNTKFYYDSHDQLIAGCSK